MDQHLDTMDARFDAVDQRLNKADAVLNALKFKQDHMSEKLDGLDLTVKYSDHNIRRDLRSLHEDVDTIVQILKIHDMIQLS